MESAASARSGMLRGSEWAPFVAVMKSNEHVGIVGAINEEILKIRAQPGSGWNEEEAKRLAKEHLENIKGVMAAGI